ncbi:M48 family metallopeptidase [Noviluteimonas gilva]|uniref:M48 family metalloprotease n=1 Tax=Noviluteimonas gilva TaxID=2682097 RepID=A0A7C9LI69_9GAMM|nr:M48 family metallopeptidase [Lysobacter gilvus]MUV15461.1 M48 family metalloprotease [Lysobacter gilvus]
MQYENPPVDHDVNVSRESVPAEFLRLCAGLAIILLALAAVLYVAGGWLARCVPFSFEQRLVGERVVGIELYERADVKHARDAERIAYLQALVDRLASRMQVPRDMPLRVHLADSDVPNAFATLGGHIVVTRGLYRRMPSENALALVLAHEIAHVRERDPISSVGGGASVALGLALLSGDGESLMPQIGQLVSLGYSRNAETRADTAALDGLRRTYGDARGADGVFDVLSGYRRESGMPDVPTLLSTHPSDRTRIERMRAAAKHAHSKAIPLRISVAD